MRNIPLIPAIVSFFAALILLTNTLFIVGQKQQALVLQFGTVTQVINADKEHRPGLYAKVPFVQTVIYFDKRNLGLDLEEQTIIAADQEQLVVDAYARWRISDPLKFYQAVQTREVAESRLKTVMIGQLRSVLGSAVSNDVISVRRAELMRQIRTQMGERAKQFGIEVIDVRIRQADLPPATAERVYERMRTERHQVAAQLRAQGDEEAAKIRADADRQVTILKAEAQQEAQKIRGDGDAKRAAIYARAYGRDAEFAAFYRSLQAYEKSIQSGTPMVIPPEGDFFRYLKNRNGR